MNKFLVASLSGAMLCCASVGFMSLVNQTAGPGPVVGVAISLLCHMVIGFESMGGQTALHRGDRAATALCALLTIPWTLVQAGFALMLVMLLGLSLSSEAATWFLSLAAVGHVILFLITHHEARSAAGNGANSL